MKEQKDVRQRIEEGEFAQSAEISASYLDEDILIIDNVKVLQNPRPREVADEHDCILSQRQPESWSINGREFLVRRAIYLSVRPTLFSTSKRCREILRAAMCVSNHGLLSILRSHISVWNRAMYVSKVSVLKMNEVDMVFYAQVYRLGARLCLDSKFNDRSSWKPYRREIVETLLKSALLAVSNLL